MVMVSDCSIVSISILSCFIMVILMFISIQGVELARLLLRLLKASKSEPYYHEGGNLECFSG